MPGIDKPTGRAVAVIVLLVVASAALRGYLPGGQPVLREHKPANGPASVVVVTLLVMSLGFLAVAVIARLRNRRAVAGATAGRPEWFRSGRKRRTWRLLLIGLVLAGAYLAIVLLLQALVGQLVVDQPSTTSTPSPTTPPSGTAAPPPPPSADTGGGGLLKYLYASTVFFLVLLAAGTIVSVRSQRRGAQPALVTEEDSAAPAAENRAETLVRAAEVGLAEARDLSREPREAIIACYTAMERELGNVPGAVPQDCDTPSEVLARAVEHHALRAESATQLVDLFEEARFSTHVMSEGQRETAVRVLRLVLQEMRSAA